jgi:hypothetical protein
MDNVLYSARFFGIKPKFSGICGGKSAIGTSFFFEYYEFPLSVSVP